VISISDILRVFVEDVIDDRWEVSEIRPQRGFDNITYAGLTLKLPTATKSLPEKVDITVTNGKKLEIHSVEVTRFLGKDRYGAIKKHAELNVGDPAFETEFKKALSETLQEF
jgi:hypothetical protein